MINPTGNGSMKVAGVLDNQKPVFNDLEQENQKPANQTVDENVTLH